MHDPPPLPRHPHDLSGVARRGAGRVPTSAGWVSSLTTRKVNRHGYPSNATKFPPRSRGRERCPIFPRYVGWEAGKGEPWVWLDSWAGWSPLFAISPNPDLSPLTPLPPSLPFLPPYVVVRWWQGERPDRAGSGLRSVVVGWGYSGSMALKRSSRSASRRKASHSSHESTASESGCSAASLRQ